MPSHKDNKTNLNLYIPEGLIKSHTISKRITAEEGLSAGAFSLFC